jgi:hypothetical protein
LFTWNGVTMTSDAKSCLYDIIIYHKYMKFTKEIHFKVKNLTSDGSNTPS